MAKKEIKLCDGFRVIHQNGVEVTEDFESIFTEMFGWDLVNNQLAKDCYEAILREVFCFGRCDLTQFTGNGETLIIEAIPVSE